VRHRCCVWLWVVILGAVCSTAQRGAEGSSTEEQGLGHRRANVQSDVEGALVRGQEDEREVRFPPG